MVPLLVVAKEQLDGRGRFLRRWVSPPTGNLYFSYGFQVDCDIQYYPLHTFIMAWSIVEVLKQWNLDARIKWPNDVRIHTKKIAGILAERHYSSLIIGVGFNYNMTAEQIGTIGKPAVALNQCLSALPDSTSLRHQIINKFDGLRAHLQTEGSAMVVSAFQQYGEMVGEEVIFNAGDKRYPIRVEGITSYGQLTGRLDNGDRIEFSGGEIVEND